jgi:hypothetical protein
MYRDNSNPGYNPTHDRELQRQRCKNLQHYEYVAECVFKTKHFFNLKNASAYDNASAVVVPKCSDRRIGSWKKRTKTHLAFKAAW